MRRDGGGSFIAGTGRRLGGLGDMNTPRQPKDPPVEPKKVDHDPASPMQNGVPEGTKQEDATAWPDSGRQKSETASNSD